MPKINKYLEWDITSLALEIASLDFLGKTHLALQATNALLVLVMRKMDAESLDNGVGAEEKTAIAETFSGNV